MGSASDGVSKYRRHIIRISYETISYDQIKRETFNYFNAQLTKGYTLKGNNWWRPSNVNILWF